MTNAQETHPTELELRQQFEIRKMELAVEFAKHGFYRTLVGAFDGYGHFSRPCNCRCVGKDRER
jgi:hypothetical protein